MLNFCDLGRGLSRFRGFTQIFCQNQDWLDLWITGFFILKSVNPVNPNLRQAISSPPFSGVCRLQTR